MQSRFHRVGAALAVAASSLLIACSSASTSVTAPSTSRCQINVSSTASSFSATGGAGTLSVVTARDCAWTVSTDASWVSISGDHNGQGEASVTYTVAANPVPVPRSGAITVGSQTVQLSQAAAPCRFSLSRPGDVVGSGGGRLSFDVSTLSGCGWNAASSDNWIAVVSGQSGNANGTVTLTVSPNVGARRVGRVSVAGQAYTVTQEAAPAPPQPAPAPSPAPSPAPPPTSPAPSPAPRSVHLDGTASGVLGSCPIVTFSVRGQRVVTDRSTEFKKSCDDLRSGRRVIVDGVESNGAVRATRVRVLEDDDNDDR